MKGAKNNTRQFRSETEDLERPKGVTMTGILATYSYVELLDMLGQLNKYSPNHELIPWVEQEIELREVLMDRQMEAMHEYAERCRDELL